LPFYDRNDYIKASELMVIDENGEKLGLLDRNTALAIAREKELDLVLISPTAKPPVARILSWTKFKYEQSRKKRENKGKKVEVKEMWFKPKIEEGDIAHKVSRIKEFITKGDRVKVTIRAQGRVTYTELRNTLARVMERIAEFATLDGDTKQEGRNISVFVKGK
jgi:translation initiation factor IF-3